MTGKILFQINYDEVEDNYKYIVNEMTNQEFLAFLMFLKCVTDNFEDNVKNEMLNNDLGEK